MIELDAKPLTIASAGRAFRDGSLSPVTLAEHCLARIRHYDGALHSVLLITESCALEDAQRAERELADGIDRGPLHGIPYGLKDIIDSAGIRTTCHSQRDIDRVPATDAEVAIRLRKAGGVLLGKMATHEFAIGGPSFDLPFPPARNPWNTDHFTGGSSSGSGAAVAAGFMPLALGSDTGGSIRLPAAYCGLAGLKPTYGRVSRRGVAPLSYSLDHVGPLTWTVEDCALSMQILAGFDAGDPGSARVPVPDYRQALDGNIRGLKVGYLRQFHARDCDEELIRGMDTAVGQLASLGAEIIEVSLPAMRRFQAAQQAILAAEGFSIHGPDLRERPETYGQNAFERLCMGAFVTGADYIDAQRAARALIAAVETVLEDVEIIACTTVPAPAPRIEDVEVVPFRSQPPLTAPFNLTGHPALSLCCGYSDTGLPLALQLVGRYFDEATVLRAGHAYEQATTWRDRRPALRDAKWTETVA
ncbi:amidase [Salinicola salarius]|uniref:amidase n=1 Tax=Salinicola salarius TaxID=430457 RepID=UPI000B3FB727|nr:amidase [Salinicola salarius]